MHRSPPNSYDGYERPGLVIAYHIGRFPIRKGGMVGLDEEGLLVPIDRAVCFVGMSHEATTGSPKVSPCINVTSVGAFVMGFVGWTPSLKDLQRPVWAYDEITVAGAPLRTGIPVGRIVALDRTCDDRPGVRVKIDAAAAMVLPPLPGKVQEAEAWYALRGRPAIREIGVERGNDPRVEPQS